MTYEQLREYLASGGTDMQYVLESIGVFSSDDEARVFIEQLFANIEAE